MFDAQHRLSSTLAYVTSMAHIAFSFVVVVVAFFFFFFRLRLDILIDVLFHVCVW